MEIQPRTKIKQKGQPKKLMQKGRFSLFFFNWKEWRGIQTNKNKNKKGSSKKNGGKRERGTIINKVLIKLEGEEEGRGRGTIMHLDLN